MKISCLCCTYNRFPNRSYLLNEAVQSFLAQSHGDKELIIVNDCPTQKLVFDHPQVTIINLPARCLTFGEKLNVAASVAQGEFLTTWDDDDISLPMRLAVAAANLEKLGSHYYKSFGQWCLTNHGMTRASNFVGHNNSTYSRKAFIKVGGYPVVSWGSDVVMDNKLKGLGPHCIGELSPIEWQYIYRWGVSGFHMSSADGGQDTDFSWKEIGKLPVVAGEYVIEPKWLYPYSTIAVAAAQSGLPVFPTPDMEFWSS